MGKIMYPRLFLCTYLLFIGFCYFSNGEAILTNSPGNTVAPNTTTTKKTTSPKTTTKKTTTSPKTTTNSPTTSEIPIVPIVPTYSVLDGKNICLLVQMNLQFKINYFDQKGVQKMRSFYLNSTTTDVRVNTGGHCSNNTQNMSLTWSPEPKSVWMLNMRFERKSTDQFTLKLVSFNYTLSDKLFIGTNDTSTHLVQQNYTGIACKIGTYYQCMATQTTELEKGPSAPPRVNQPKTFVIISDMRAEAFRSSSNPIFVGSKCECSADYVPNKVIPIVVGVALAVMILIALITFIVGSRRRQVGYQEI